MESETTGILLSKYAKLLLRVTYLTANVKKNPNKEAIAFKLF